MPRTPSSSTQFAKWLAGAGAPVYWVDSQRRIRFANVACVEWTGVESTEFEQHPCNYHSQATDDRLSRLAADLCPPPAALDGALQVGQLTIHSAAGQVSRRSATFIPLTSRGVDAAGVIVVVGAQELSAAAQPSPSDAVSSEDLHRVLQALRNERDGGLRVDALVGASPTMRRAREQMRAAVESQARTVIIGPPGSGREQVARSVFRHRAPNSRMPLLTLACPLLDGDAIQRAISGYLAAPVDEPGATRTLLLLDADHLSVDAQQVLAQFAFAPRVTWTTLATASRSLAALDSSSGIRADLGAWLTTLEIHIPPLATRREDIPLAAQMAVELANARGGRQLSGCSPEALDALVAYSWPGNLRQLLELLGEACESCVGSTVGMDSLPDVLRHATAAAAHPPVAKESLNLDALLLEVEREVIARALRKAKGNRAKAARLLGISRPRLLRRLEQLDLSNPIRPAAEGQVSEPSEE